MLRSPLPRSADPALSLHSLPLLGLGTEEIEVTESSDLVGKRIDELEAEHVGVHILGLRREQQLHKWHEIDDPLRSGDVVVAAGRSRRPLGSRLQRVDDSALI